MKNNYKRYCIRCHYTMYSGEEVTKTETGFAHQDCKIALSDKNIVRRLNPRIENLLGKVNKKKLVKMLESYPTSS